MRFFKKYVGMSCLDYIKSLRLQKAADLLEQQELSITDAALSAGTDARHGLIGPGVYASHGYERSHKEGAAATLALLQAYLG